MKAAGCLCWSPRSLLTGGSSISHFFHYYHFVAVIILVFLSLGPSAGNALSWHDIRSHGRVSLVVASVTAVGTYYLTTSQQNAVQRPAIVVVQQETADQLRESAEQPALSVVAPEPALSFQQQQQQQLLQQQEQQQLLQQQEQQQLLQQQEQQQQQLLKQQQQEQQLLLEQQQQQLPLLPLQSRQLKQPVLFEGRRENDAVTAEVAAAPTTTAPVGESTVRAGSGWPRQPSALSDKSLTRIANRVASAEAQADFNRTLDTICVERQPGTAAHEKVREFIESELRALDWTIEEDSFSAPTPRGQKPFTNIVATLDPSACHRVVLACHYDSKVMRNFEGATDSAVPCSQMLSIVKLLDPELKAHVDRKSGLTLQLIFFDGEEAFKTWSSTDSLYGARHLADLWHRSPFDSDKAHCQSSAAEKSIVNELDRIEVFVLLDLLGTKNPTFYSFFADTKQLFDQMTEIEVRLNRLGLMEGRTKYFTGRSQFGAIEDDHIPFMRRDVPILHIIAHPFPRVWHTISDNKQNLDWPTMWNLNKIFTAFVAWYMEL